MREGGIAALQSELDALRERLREAEELIGNLNREIPEEPNIRDGFGPFVLSGMLVHKLRRFLRDASGLDPLRLPSRLSWVFIHLLAQRRLGNEDINHLMDVVSGLYAEHEASRYVRRKPGPRNLEYWEKAHAAVEDLLRDGKGEERDE